MILAPALITMRCANELCHEDHVEIEHHADARRRGWSYVTPDPWPTCPGCRLDLRYDD